jgi:hypothetical protein
VDNGNYRFSQYGIKNPEIFERIYQGFIEWCKTKASSGTFSTYCDGEPVFMSAGFELSYRDYQKATK